MEEETEDMNMQAGEEVKNKILIKEENIAKWNQNLTQKEK